jgi:hypothetical protein
MGWSKVQQKRLQVERLLLAHYFSKFAWTNPLDPEKTTVEGDMQTNANALYGIRLYVPANFPLSRPDVVIRSPNPLQDAWGGNFKEASAAMHTLLPRDGYIRLCLYRDWVPTVTLYHALLKARLWLEAFDARQGTGRTIDHFLRHE